jgi:hypothetical protein
MPVTVAAAVGLLMVVQWGAAGSVLKRLVLPQAMLPQLQVRQVCVFK